MLRYKKIDCLEKYKTAYPGIDYEVGFALVVGGTTLYVDKEDYFLLKDELAGSALERGVSFDLKRDKNLEFLTDHRGVNLLLLKDYSHLASLSQILKILGTVNENEHERTEEIAIG